MDFVPNNSTGKMNFVPGYGSTGCDHGSTADGSSSADEGDVSVGGDHGSTGDMDIVPGNSAGEINYVPDDSAGDGGLNW